MHNTVASVKIRAVALAIQSGGVVAYPTEAVFGLGCNPFCPSAVARLLAIKQRSPKKGLILIAHHWSVLLPLLKPIPNAVFQKIQNTITPCTWVLPASKRVPGWITGQHKSVAVRVTHHPIAKALCARLGMPLVSTSANRANLPPARTALAVRLSFKNQLDCILSGKVGTLAAPTPIVDPYQDRVLRAGG